LVFSRIFVAQLDRERVLLNISTVQLLYRHLAAFKKRQLQPWLNRLRSRYFARRPTRRQIEIQLEFPWKSKF
jgi:hypothetical protein